MKALAKIYAPTLGREIDAMNEVLITIGADGSLFNSALGLINPGEEV